MGDSEHDGPDGPDGLNSGFGFDGTGPADSGGLSSFSGSGLSLGGGSLGLHASPGSGLGLAAPGGPGLSAASPGASSFAGSVGQYSGYDGVTAGQVASAQASLAVADAEAAAKLAAEQAKQKQVALTGAKMGLSAVSPAAAALVGIGSFLADVFGAFSGGVAGTAGPSPGRGDNGRELPAGYAWSNFSGVSASPVMGYAGAPINGAKVPQFPGLAGYSVPGYGTSGRYVSPSGFVAGQPGTQSNLAPLLLAGAGLFFIGS